MQQLRLVLFGSVAALGFATFACDGNGSQGQAVPRTEIVDTAVNSMCGGLGTCCQSKGFAFNAANCDSYLRSQLTPESICPSNDVYDAQAAGDCYAAMQTSYAACGSMTTNVEACARMCSGNSPNGGACTSSRDCAQPSIGSAICRTSNGGAGVCVTEIRVTLGDACDETCSDSSDGMHRVCTYSAGASLHNIGTQCYTNDGLYCASENTCKAQLTLGSACTELMACQSGSHCNLDSAKCEANVQAGSSCPSGNECNDSSYCDPSKVCASKKATGQSCTDYQECLGACDTTRGQCVDHSGAPPVSAAFCSDPSSG